MRCTDQTSNTIDLDMLEGFRDPFTLCFLCSDLLIGTSYLERGQTTSSLITSCFYIFADRVRSISQKAGCFWVLGTRPCCVFNDYCIVEEEERPGRGCFLCRTRRTESVDGTNKGNPYTSFYGINSNG